MIHGLFLDPRIWKIDYITSPFWDPKKYDVCIDLHPDAFNIPKLGIDKKYKFVLASEVWEIPMRKTLEYLKKRGLKIFLIPRELLPARSHFGIMFSEDKYKYNGEFFFKPDFIFAPGQHYANMWDEHNIPVEIIGYPRFDVYLKNKKNKNDLCDKYKINKNKKILFFPSYPPYIPQTINKEHVIVDLYQDLQDTMYSLKQFALKNKNDVQVIVKIHPMAQKCYNKKIGRGNEVSGLLEHYYKRPNDYIKVIGDNRLNSDASRDILLLSDFVVGYSSMMMLEAIFLNKPVLFTKLSQSCQLKGVLDYSGFITTATSKNELENLLDDVLLSTDKFLVHNKSVIEPYLYKIDGKFCERLCSSIKKIMR